MNVCVVGDQELVTGFALAGVKDTVVVKTKEEAKKAVETTKASIVIVREELSALVQEHKEKVIVRISETKTSDSTLMAIIKNAIGFEIKV